MIDLELGKIPENLHPTIELYLRRLADQDKGKLDELAGLLSENGKIREQLLRVWVASDYAANLCIRNPQWILELQQSSELEPAQDKDFSSELARVLAPCREQSGLNESGLDENALKQALRRNQQKQMLRLIWRDVCRISDVHRTSAEVSALASAVLDETLKVLHHHAVQKHGEPLGEYSNRAQQMLVLGMGKLGAGELNLSSDIDLIFAYPEAGETRAGNSAAKSTTNQQFFLRLGQQLVDALDAVTADGFVFRVDMRLRPYGSDGALVCSFDAMENYYQSQGRDWERYAMIKARTVAGDREAGAELLERLRPFVYRRYLDFSAFEALRSLKLQINKQVRRKGMSRDVKLGPGGIREAEFVVQALQLVHGGRDSSLQQASLYAAMENLQKGGYLPEGVVVELEEAYSFLRNLEHKLQGFANKQTQALPAKAEEMCRIALAMGFDGWDELSEELNRQRKRVAGHFEDVIRTEDEDEAEHHDVKEGELPALWQQELDDEQAEVLLSELGFEAPQESWKLLCDFRKERHFVTLPAESRQRFNRFMPLLLATLAEEKTPGVGLVRVMKMVEAVLRRTAYLVLLIENPGAMKQFVRLCTASPFIAEFLSIHPVLLDELLDGIDEPPGKSELQDELAQQLLRIEAENFEAQMEYLRYFKLSHTLQVAAAQITEKMTVMKVSDYLTFTAEAVLEQVLALSWQTLVRKHGYPVNNQGKHGEMDFLVLGYGKLGGIELSYISDLDIVFLHDGALDENTIAGAEQKSINSREFYTRLAQRVITMLDTQTVSGRLYEVDMRLRPSGESGLLVSSLLAFEKYQLQDAWTWEHQALVRARAVAGSPALAEAFSALRATLLSQARKRKELAADVIKMRLRMRDELTRKAGRRKADSPPFVIKQGRGGIVDIEFIVQFLVLSRSDDCPAMLDYSDNMRILEAARGCSLLPVEDIEALMEAYLALRATLHRYALQQSDLEDPLGSLSDHREQVCKLWDSVFRPYQGE